MGDVQVASEVVIAAPAAAVFAVVANFARNPEWQDGMRSCDWVTDPPIAVGSRYQQEAGFLGRTITTVFEVTAVERDDDGGGSISIVSHESTFPLQITRTVRPHPDGCVVTADVAGQPDGLMGLASPLMGRMVKRSVDGDYQRLKQLVEATTA